ncbi:MAG: hypothetical protein ACI83Y_002295 [Candidatus Azotimanducaceae bacterium]|mgnify:CR=1 FL=1|jgi:hypothetical protein|tara:strand:+ start:530 stop:1108 length:579 start_codon:yes stop_codon:yes gene_type:complete
MPSFRDIITYRVSNRLRLLRLAGLVALSASTVALVGVAPASAALTGDTTATVTITGGALVITVPVDAASLGTAAGTIGGSTISGQLGEVQVNDNRSGVAGWVASAISTAFTPDSGLAIPAGNVGYTAGTITKVGIATYLAPDPGNLAAASPVVTASTVVGNNSATWNPTINVAVPGATLAGTYSATITHSVT